MFYISIAVMGLIWATWLRFSLRLPDDTINNNPDLNTYEIAFLAGGNRRMIMTAITSLVKQGCLEIVKEKLPSGIFRTTRSKLVLRTNIGNIADPIEKAVAQDILTTDGTIEQAFQQSTTVEDSIRSRLQQLRLFLSNDQAFKAQLYPSLIVGILLGLGLCKLLVGIYCDKPVDFLDVCVWVLLALGARFFVKPHRSHYGDRIFNDLIARSQDLKTSSSSDSKLVLAVAVFGATVLTADSALADLYQMFASTSGGGGGGDGGDGGDGGCGGCGGCGGGG
jgi:uncharacterized protein (TIGR04222 family)